MRFLNFWGKKSQRLEDVVWLDIADKGKPQTSVSFDQDIFSAVNEIVDTSRIDKSIDEREESKQPVEVASGLESEPHLSDEEKTLYLHSIRQAFNPGKLKEAAELCNEIFGRRLDVTDEYNHPIYYTEMYRITLAMNDEKLSSHFAALLRPLLLSNDMSVEILFARQMTANRHPRHLSAWQAVIAQAPNNEEAKNHLIGASNHQDP